MKNIKLAETAARYGMTARAFERLLEELGWMEDGRINAQAICDEFLTENREITMHGLGFLDGYLGRRF